MIPPRMINKSKEAENGKCNILSERGSPRLYECRQ